MPAPLPLEAPNAAALATAEARLLAAGGGTTEDELRLAAHLETRGQREAAIAHYEAAAAVAPRDRRPLAALERLIASTGDHEALGAIIGRLIVASDEPQARAELWFRRGRLYRDVLHNELEAYRCFKEAHAHAPDDATIARALRTIAMARGAWALAAELMYREIAAASTPGQAAALHLELAIVYDQKLLDAQQARINYEQALALDATIVAAPAPLARLYELSREPALAARMYERAAALAPGPRESGQMLRRGALAAEQAGELDHARELYERAAAIATSDDDLGVANAALARLTGDAPAALGELLELRLLEAGSDEERLDLLHQLQSSAVALENHAAAARYATAILELAPGHAGAFDYLRQRAIARDDAAAVAELLERRAANVADPGERAVANYELGRHYQREQYDANAATAAFERALSADPHHHAAREALAELAYARRDWPRAAALFERLEPTSSLSPERLSLRRGAVAEALGEIDAALDHYRAALRANPRSGKALRATARCARRIGALDLAIEAHRTLLAELPADDVLALGEARLELAQLCQQAGEAAAAIYYYELVLADAPRADVALRPLVELYLATQDVAGAARALRELVALSTTAEERAALLFRVGEVYLNARDPQRAADAYLKAIDLAPTHVPTLRRLLEHFWRSGDHQALLEIAADLDRQQALLATETAPEALGYVVVTAALAGELSLASETAEWLGDAAAPALAAALRDAVRRDPNASDASLVRIARDLSDSAGGYQQIVAAVARDARDERERALARSLAAHDTGSSH